MLAALFALVGVVEAPPKKKKGSGPVTPVSASAQAAEGRSWFSCCLPWGSKPAVEQLEGTVAIRSVPKKYFSPRVHVADTAVDDAAVVVLAPSAGPVRATARARQRRVAFATPPARDESDSESGRGRSRPVRNRRHANTGRDFDSGFSVPGLLGAANIKSNVTGARFELQTPPPSAEFTGSRVRIFPIVRKLNAARNAASGGYSSASSATMTGSAPDAAMGVMRPVPRASLPAGRSVAEMMSGYDAPRGGDSDSDFEACRPPMGEFTGSRARRRRPVVRRLDMDKVVVVRSGSDEAPALQRSGVSPVVAVGFLPSGLSASPVRRRQLRVLAERRRGEERSRSPRTSPTAASAMYRSPSVPRPVGRRGGVRPLPGLTAEQMTGDASVDVKKLAAAQALNRDAHRRVVTGSSLGTAQSPRARRDSGVSPAVEDDGTVLEDLDSGAE